MAHASRLQKWQGPNILNLNLTLHANVSTFWNSSPSSMNIKISCPLENHWWSLFYVTISPTTNIILKLVSLAWTSPLNSKTSVSNIKLNIFSPRMPNRHLKLDIPQRELLVSPCPMTSSSLTFAQAETPEVILDSSFFHIVSLIHQQILYLLYTSKVQPLLKSCFTVIS